MHQGQLVFAQLMRHLPLTTLRRESLRDAAMPYRPCNRRRYATLSIGDWFTNCRIIHAMPCPECYITHHSF
jgi:hypothetical protein